MLVIIKYWYHVSILLWLLEEYPLIFINHGLAKSGVDINTNDG